MGYDLGLFSIGLQTYTLYLDNGGSSGTGYFHENFDWQLGGPFSSGVRTGIAPFPGSLDVVSTLTLPRQRF